jgi:hypothetical protein
MVQGGEDTVQVKLLALIYSNLATNGRDSEY